METTVSLLTTFFITIAVAGISAWIAYSLGTTKEGERGRETLEKANKEASETLENERAENQKKLEVMNKAAANDLEQAKQAHSQQTDQLNTAHQTLVDSLKNDHSSLIDRLNASNNANISELEKRRQQEIADARQEHQQTIETLKGEHDRAVQQINEERDRRLKELAERHSEELGRAIADADALRSDRDTKAEQVAGLEKDLGELREEVKEGKLNNMFSVSKSGEKLIRVVRSVQELATELDETSRAVTGGDYSFFDQIKDQRDRDTVLSLAAGGIHAYSEAGAETAVDDDDKEADEEKITDV